MPNVCRSAAQHASDEINKLCPPQHWLSPIEPADSVGGSIGTSTKMLGHAQKLYSTPEGGSNLQRVPSFSEQMEGSYLTCSELVAVLSVWLTSRLKGGPRKSRQNSSNRPKSVRRLRHRRRQSCLSKQLLCAAVPCSDVHDVRHLIVPHIEHWNPNRTQSSGKSSALSAGRCRQSGTAPPPRSFCTARHFAVAPAACVWRVTNTF